MKNKLWHFIIFIICFSLKSFAWGFFGHQRINRMAVFTLPPEMFSFYKTHIEYVTTHAVDPDKRRYANKNEGACHFIDIDHYEPFAFDSLPHFYPKAIKKYTEDTLLKHGIVPWHIAHYLHYLTQAFENEDINKILKLSADIGHYIADAHVPLHTTKNYNGQLSNQHGIHGLWESRVPEVFADNYNYLLGQAQYIQHPNSTIWKMIKDSYAAVDSVLSFEENLHRKWPANTKYTYEQKGATLKKNYSLAYTTQYHELLSGQVERRMRESVHMVASFWLTAWTNAGKPNLDKLSPKNVIENLQESPSNAHTEDAHID